jgi:hypothetical protein
MLHCPKCDQLVNRHCKFCPHCGLPLADDSAVDPTVMGAAAPALAATPLALARRRGLLYGGIAAGALILILGIIIISVGHSRAGTSPSALRQASPHDALYGRAAVVNPGSAGVSWNSTQQVRQITPLGPPVLASPSNHVQYRQAPVVMAENTFSGPPDLFAPPVSLYQPVYYDESPPLSSLPTPQASQSPTSAPPVMLNNETEPSMSPFNPVGNGSTDGAAEQQPATENPTAGQSSAAAGTQPAGPTVANGGTAPATGSMAGYAGYPGYGFYGGNPFGGYGAYGVPAYQNYSNLPNGYPVLTPFGAYFRR